MAPSWWNPCGEEIIEVGDGWVRLAYGGVELPFDCLVEPAIKIGAKYTWKYAPDSDAKEITEIGGGWVRLKGYEGKVLF